MKNSTPRKKKMVSFTMSVPKAMEKALEEEMISRKVDTIQEAIKRVLAESLELKE